ncbi:MAG: cation diffusion facilitator family transporter [Desulfocapsaceae bacterium]
MNEQRGLKFSTAGNLIIGMVGVMVAIVSHSQAIMLDGVFNLIYFVTGLFTLKVARLVIRGDDERFPVGYGFFEPLINGIKGLMVLGISVMALIGAVEALLSGGRAIALGYATAYGFFAAISCWSLALLTHRAAKKTGSPLLRADAENWLVNGAISSAVLLAFLGVFLIQNTRYSHLTPYIDPLLVLTVVLISISVPIRMAWKALMELLNRAPSAEVVKSVEEVVALSLEALPVVESFVRVLQPGRTRMVSVHVVVPKDYQISTIGELDEIRTGMLIELEKLHGSTFVDVLFTEDRRWGAPLGSGD